jgi:hypothetical protein
MVPPFSENIRKPDGVVNRSRESGRNYPGHGLPKNKKIPFAILPLYLTGRVKKKTRDMRPRPGGTHRFLARVKFQYFTIGFFSLHA